MNDKYALIKWPHRNEKTYIPIIKRRWLKRAFFRARDAVAYRRRVIDRYERLKEAAHG